MYCSVINVSIWKSNAVDHSRQITKYYLVNSVYTETVCKCYSFPEILIQNNQLDMYCVVMRIFFFFYPRVDDVLEGSEFFY